MKALDGFLMGLSCLRSAAALRRTFRFDLIDAHWAYPDGVAAAFLARLWRVPLAVTVRGDDINIFPKTFWRRQWIRWALRRADVVIAVSGELGRCVAALGIEESRIRVIPNGVDLERFAPTDKYAARKRLNLRQDAKIVLSVGRLHASKGFPIVVEAAGRLKDQFPDLLLAIVGAPDSEADATAAIEEMAVRWGIRDRVHLTGALPPAVVADWYAAADLFCLATAREGCANVVLEALASGLPCVTTPVGGNNEIVSSPDVGMLVDADAGAMKTAIASALARNWDRRRIAEHVKRRTWRAVGEECHLRLLDLIEPPAPQDRANTRGV